MAASITLFANNTSPTGPELDGNFTAFAVFGNIPCTVSGTNTLTLVQNANTPVLTQLVAYQRFSGVFANNNSGALTLQVAAFTVLNGYKDSGAGPVPFVGGECIAGNAFTAEYDPALNSGNGGYHVSTSTQLTGGTIVGNLTLSNGVLSVLGVGGTVGASLTSTLLTGNSLTISGAALQIGTLGSTLATLTRMVSGLGTLTFTLTPANTTQDQQFALPGAQLRDVVSLGLGTTVPVGAGFQGWCGTIGTITVRLLNPTASSITLTSMTIRAMAMGLTP